ncbi:MAG: aminopeptidase [Candidatus Dormibacteria bacterium]
METREEPRSESQMRKSAELIVDVCFAVKEGDVVTIITDNRRKEEAELLATVVAERGGWPMVANNDTQVRRGLQDTLFPMAPPRNLHTAMVNSDSIIIVTNLEWANRFAHVSAVRESVDRNARIGSVEEGFGRWPISVEDIERTMANANAAIAALTGKKRVRVTSPGGTDVEVSIERRPALAVVPVKERGAMMGPVPLWGEVAYAAVEDQTAGRIVVDGNMLGIGVPGHVSTPITWHVENGQWQAIEGKEEADRLRSVIEKVEGTRVVGEFAFGTSDYAPLGSPSEKGRKGTVHFALGDNKNCYPGGQNVSKLHLDGVCLDASIQILDTGEYIVKDGVWQL